MEAVEVTNHGERGVENSGDAPNGTKRRQQVVLPKKVLEETLNRTEGKHFGIAKTLEVEERFHCISCEDDIREPR